MISFRRSLWAASLRHPIFQCSSEVIILTLPHNSRWFAFSFHTWPATPDISISTRQSAFRCSSCRSFITFSYILFFTMIACKIIKDNFVHVFCWRLDSEIFLNDGFRRGFWILSWYHMYFMSFVSFWPGLWQRTDSCGLSDIILYRLMPVSWTWCYAVWIVVAMYPATETFPFDMHCFHYWCLLNDVVGNYDSFVCDIWMVIVGFRYTDELNLYSVWLINTYS